MAQSGIARSEWESAIILSGNSVAMESKVVEIGEFESFQIRLEWIVPQMKGRSLLGLSTRNP
jgi:hypothetical protein